MLESPINATARVIEAIAAVMIAASVAGGVLDLAVAAARRALVQRTTEARLRLAERLVVSIEFLIAADILKTVVTPTLEGIGLFAGIIVIRTVLSLSIAYELRRASTPAHPSVRGVISLQRRTFLVRRIRTLAPLLTAPMLILVGCVSVTPNERFPDVARAINERMAQRVHWRLGAAEDQQADAFVDELLSRPLTPESAVQVALLRSRDLQSTYEDLGVAQADLVHAGLLKNPDLAGFFRIPDSGPSGVNWNVGLDFWLDIFLVPLRKRIAGAELEASLLRVTDAVLDKATQVRRAYFQYLADQRVLAHQRALAEFADVAAELSRRQQAQGHIADLDSANQQAAAEEAGLALDQAEAAARISRETLRRLLDLTDSELAWTIDETLAAIPPGDPDAESLVATSLDKRVDLALLSREIELQRLGLDLDKKWFLAKGSVGVETERSSDGVQGTGPHFNVELPIFHQHQAVYARREALIRQAEDRLAARRGAARAEVRIAAERMALARRAADRYERAIVPLRQKIVGLTQAEYNAMIVGVPDLLAAKSAETRVGIDQARAVQDYWTARAELERVIGVKLPELPAGAAPPPPQESKPEAMPDMPGMSKPVEPPPSPH